VLLLELDTHAWQKKNAKKKRIKICGRKQDLLATLIQTSENIFNSFIKF